MGKAYEFLESESPVVRYLLLLLTDNYPALNG